MRSRDTKRHGEFDLRALTGELPSAFLLVLETDDDDDDEQEFKTVMASMPDLDPEPEPAAPLEAGSLIALVKTDANPYEGRIIVGRARNCDVVFREPTVSKFHADIRELGEGQIQVTDRRSRNGTAVNGVPLRSGKPQTVKSGDRVTFGSVSTVYLTADEVQRARA